MPNSEARQIIIESLAFENASSLHKRSLKARPAPLVEWIWDTINIEFHEDDDAWIGEVISRGLRKNWNVQCYTCDKQSHLKRDCRQGVPRKKKVLSKNKPFRITLFPNYMEDVAKAGIGLMNIGQWGIFMVILCHQETPWRAYCRFLCQIQLSHFLSL